MIEVLKERSLRYVALLDIDGTSVPTLDSMAVWLQKEGRQWTREQVLSAPLGHNSNPELHREQIQLIHDPIFLRSLSPHPGTINALGMLQAHGFPYIAWSARSINPKETRDATVDWIKETLTPSPMEVILKANHSQTGEIFKGSTYLGIRDGQMDDAENIIVPVCAFEDDSVVGAFLAELGLNVFLIRGSEAEPTDYSSPFLFGPFETLETAIPNFLYLWHEGKLTVRLPEDNVIRRRFTLRKMCTDSVREGLVSDFS